jgi:hypothetical protein
MVIASDVTKQKALTAKLNEKEDYVDFILKMLKNPNNRILERAQLSVYLEPFDFNNEKAGLLQTSLYWAYYLFMMEICLLTILFL